jgi:hypothetical protein
VTINDNATFTLPVCLPKQHTQLLSIVVPSTPERIGQFVTFTVEFQHHQTCLSQPTMRSVLTFLIATLIYNAYAISFLHPYGGYSIIKLPDNANGGQITLSTDECHLISGSGSSVYHMNLRKSTNIWGQVFLTAEHDYTFPDRFVSPKGVWIFDNNLYVRDNNSIYWYLDWHTYKESQAATC